MKPVNELVAGVPPEVVEIIGLALRKDPKDRWQSMQVIHKVLAEQKQKFDSGVFSNPSLIQPPRAPSSIAPGPAGPGMGKPKSPRKKLIWIAIGLSFIVWGKSCGSSRDKVKVDTNIPGVTVSIPGVTDGVPRSRKSGGTLNNQSIIDMLEAEVPESVIVSHIHASKTKFTLSTDEIIRLTKAGATPAVIDAMRNPAAAPPAAPAPDSPPDVKIPARERRSK